MLKVLQFLSLVFLLVGTPASAIAESVGIDFASMPKNLKMQYSNNQGGGWVEIYRGKRKGLYMVEVYGLNGERRYRAYYNSAGLLERREYANGNVRRFSPNHCQRVLGACNYAYSNSQGSDGSGTAKLTKRGKTYTYSWKVSGKTRKFTYVLGQYNLMVSGRNPDRSKFKLENLSIAQ